MSNTKKINRLRIFKRSKYIKEKYEEHHNVVYTEDAILACVNLTSRYITDRFLPDKAIDAMDEAGSRVYIKNMKVPTAIIDFEKKIEDYKKTADRYESEPDTKEGKKELMARAKAHEATRDHAMQQDPWFDYAEGALQIAIVLLSVSIVASMPVLYWAGTLLGTLGFVSTVNGYFLFF